MGERVSDIDILLIWNRTGEHLKAETTEGTLLFNTNTGFVSPLLSERQVKCIQQDFNRKKKNYVF
jgi:hypothetical protein